MDHTDDEGSPSITFRSPTPADAPAMWRIARDSGALDLNSPYAYLLVGDHFAATSVVAEGRDGDLAGFVAAYLPPTEPDLVFVWQVAVDHSHRGAGVARRLIHEAIDRAWPLGARGLMATVTPGNEPSRRLFRSVAADRGAAIDERPLYDAALFPGDDHEPENRLLVAPFGPPAT